jgi:hypothetical protein
MRTFADHEALQPRLDALLDEYEKQFQRATSLEKRVASLMERHGTHVRISFDKWLGGVRAHVDFRSTRFLNCSFHGTKL